MTKRRKFEDTKMCADSEKRRWLPSQTTIKYRWTHTRRKGTNRRLMNYLTRNQTASSSRRCSGKQFQKMAVSRLVLHIPTVALRPVCPSAIHLNARTRDRHRRTAALRSLGLAYSGCAALADPFDLRVPIKYILVPVAGNWLRRRSRLVTTSRLETNNSEWAGWAFTMAPLRHNLSFSE